jgi:S-adenosylmethionine decarboxylase
MPHHISRPDRLTHEASSAWGLSTAVDVYDCDPFAIRSREHIVRFTHELCNLLGVKRFGETQVVRFGDDPRIHGYSMVQLIETSLVSGHFAEESNAAYIDIFSCKWYDSAQAVRFTQEFFRAGRVQVQTCQRR